MKSGSKTALISFLVMIAVIAVLFGAYILMARFIDISSDSRTAEELLAEAEAEKELFPKLDKLYSEGDYEGLVGLLFSEQAGKIDVWNYDHYDFVVYYRKYLDVRDHYIPMLDEGNLNGLDARELTDCVFSYYYRSYDYFYAVDRKLIEDDILILDNIRDNYMLEILHKRMGYTEEDMEAAKKEIMKNGYFHSDNVYEFSDRYYERYK